MPRTSRRSEVAPSTSSASHTPVVNPPASARPPSPLSPAMMSRIEEKKEMRNLNDRLAFYIESIRRQESEISSLQQHISTIEETKSSEVKTLRSAYNHELEQLRKALDDTSKEKAKLQIEAEKYEKENRDLVKKLREKESAFDRANKDLKAAQAKASQLQDELTQAQSELAKNSKLEKKLEDAKRNLEDETLKRIDLQNQLQTTKESMRFEQQMVEQQLNESKIRKQMEISEIDNRLTGQYEEKLQQSLSDMREAYEKEIAAASDQTTRNLEARIKDLSNKLDAERAKGGGAAHELRELETRVTTLTSRNRELETVKQQLDRRIEELTREIEEADRRHRADLARKDAEIRSKDERLDALTRDYSELMELKVALDLEIAAYRKLLESEEARLGIGQAGSPDDRPQRGVKRRRITTFEEDIELASEHSGLGNVLIEPLDKDGRFITISNKSGGDLSLAQWSLVNEGGDSQTAFKFLRNAVLKAGEDCTVWSADAQVEHNPPRTLVMKRGGWTLSDENTTVVRNKENLVEATRISRKGHVVSGSHREGFGHLYGQAAEEQKSCLIM